MYIFSAKKIFITGGLGFIGSNLICYLKKNKYNGEIIIFDNNSIDNVSALNKLKEFNHLKIIYGDLRLTQLLDESIKSCDLVVHLAANSDISKGIFNPKIDFENTVLGTQNLLNSMLKNNVKNIIFSSGSGVYGNVVKKNIPEDYGPLIPVSHYGASKLCAESMISSYVFMHDFNALVFRFANVIGTGQTHGVAYDFIRKVKKNNLTLQVLGNGTQLKSYIDINDIIKAIDISSKKFSNNIDFYNVCTDDSITVREIATMVIKKMKVNLKINFGKSNFGWRGDVPKISLSNEKIKSIGWIYSMNTQQAMEHSINEMLKEIS